MRGLSPIHSGGGEKLDAPGSGIVSKHVLTATALQYSSQNVFDLVLLTGLTDRVLNDCFTISTLITFCFFLKRMQTFRTCL